MLYFSDEVIGVSIHAPYAGSDALSIAMTGQTFVRFNPRPLCRERPIIPVKQFNKVQFQSTPPMQGAT